LNGRITAIRFETQEKDNFITSKSSIGKKSQSIKHSMGTVKGIVQSLTMRNQLKFTIWDALFDKGVTCYLDKGQEEIMREVWGKKVIISGRIGRHPETGLPVVIRQISDIQVIPEIEPGSYRRARGVIPWKEGIERPEDVIRRLRNG